MIRTRKIIGKNEVFDYVGNPFIAKVEINTAKQKSLKNKEICSVYIYHRVNWNDVCIILGKCAAATLNDLGHREDYKAFVTGLFSVKRNGFMSKSMINKLIEIEKNTGYKFQIPKTIKALCE